MGGDYVRPLRAAGEDEDRDPLSGVVIAAAIEVHRILGPGLSEAMYEEALCHELDCKASVTSGRFQCP
jgi:hypothetical protein